MELIVHSFADEELAAFAPVGKRSFAVRMSFSVDTTTAGAGHEAFGTFLDHAAALAAQGKDAVEVFAYHGTTVMRLDPAMFEVRFENAAAAIGERFKDWFRKRVGGLKDATRFSALLVPGDDERSEDELSAEHVLAGVTTWPAPLPHRLGLAWRIDVQGLDAAHSLLVVPRVGGATTGIVVGGKFDAGNVDMERIDVPYGAAVPPGPAYALCRAGVARAPNLSTGKTLVDPGTGFVQAQFENDELGRAIRCIEQRGGSLFTGYLAASGIAWPDVLYANQPDADGNPVKAPDEKQRAYWLVCLAARAALTVEASLDTLLLALLMPGRDKMRDGLALGPFLDELIRVGVLDSEGSVSQRRRTLRRDIRLGLREFAALPPSGPGELPPCIALIFGEQKPSPFLNALLLFAFSPTRASFHDVVREATKVAEAVGPEMKISQELLRAEVDSALNRLNESVLSEKGAERAMVALLRNKQVKAAVSKGDAAIEAAYDRGLDGFETLLDQGFNGAEAARQSVGSLIADLAAKALADEIRTAKADGQAFSPSPARLREIMGSWRFWTARVDHLLAYGITPGKPLVPELVRLTRPLHLLREGAGLGDYTQGFEAIQKAVYAAAGEMERRSLDELFPPDDARFIPDHAPQPLLVQISLDPFIDDETSPDSFSVSFAGVGVLVREGESDWAHACLSKLHPPPAPPADLATHADFTGMPLTIAPLPSAVVDGRRELIIAYPGHSFSSAAYADAISPADRDPGEDPFYLIDQPDASEPDASELGAYDDLPPLADGQLCHFAAHVVSRSGSLPNILQQPASLPWIPLVTVGHDVIPHIAMSLAVSRRTAIGRVVISDPPNAVQKRLGMRPDGLQPLSADYRRLSVTPGVWLDVLRHADGTGAITLPGLKQAPTRVVLRDLQCWDNAGKTTTLKIAIATRPDARCTDHPNYPSIELVAGQTGYVVIEIARNADHSASVSVTCHRDGEEKTTSFPNVAIVRDTCWLSLSIEAGASVSLADPSLDSDTPSVAGRGEPDNLLLLGAPFPRSNQPVWRTPFDTKAEVDIVLPRMTLGAFLRWTNNTTLRDVALELGSSTADNERKDRIKLFNEFRALMVALDIDRLNAREFAARLDLLPDLAVTGVELSAAPLDSLVLPPAEMATKDARARATIASLPMPTLGTLLSDTDVKKAINGRRIVAALELIDAKLRHRMVIETRQAQPGADGKLAFTSSTSPKGLTVGGGLVARVSARPLVPKHRFEPQGKSPSAIDPRMLQFAIGEKGDAHIFDGAHVVIETMIGPLVRDQRAKGDLDWLAPREIWAKERAEAVGHLPAGSSPMYQLAILPKPAEHWRWRQVGTVTTLTQAWRFCGRPIRNWIRPLEHVDKKKIASTDQASFHMDEDLGDRFMAFESDAFRPRDDLDAVPETVKLGPLGQRTTLAGVQPDETKGATIFRHAFTLSSRYAAAMLRPESDGAAEAWKLDAGAQPNAVDRWMRVAVLARRPRELTRPQLRALLPLTRRTQDDVAGSFAPPALAVLNEAPFANGGLAARIAAEIRTGVGYGKDEDADQVRPQDFRKEVGPDGRLRLVPMSEGAARRAVLAPESPIGLTFDREGTTAPAFANAALILHPSLVPADPPALDGQAEGAASDEGVSEESFISVALRRYLDPAWLVGDAAEATVLSFDQSALWIEAEGEFKILLKPQDKARTEIPFEGVSATNDKVTVHPRLIDPSVKEGRLLDLCARPTPTLAFLIVPQDDGRFTLSVFTRPDQPHKVSGKLPILLASAECRVPERFAVELEGEMHISRTTASALTGLEWVRTNPDFDHVTVVKPSSPHSAMRMKVKDLAARRSGPQNDKRVTFHSAHSAHSAQEVLWVRAHHSTRTEPTATHRFMLALFVKTLRGIGPDIETLLGAALMFGSQVPVSGSFAAADAVRFVEVEAPAGTAAYPRKNVLPVFQRAYFDLTAIGAAITNGEGRRFLFRIRPVGGMAAFLQAHESNVTLGLASGAGDPFLKPVARGVRSTATELLLLLQPSDGEIHWKILVVEENGEIKSNQAGHAALPAAFEHLWLSLEEVSGQVAGAQVSFVNASMLTSLNGRSLAPSHEMDFDFHWLFGVVDKDVGRPDDPTELAALHEAQVRCVSVSPALLLADVT
jgi:hypothetical protein